MKRPQKASPSTLTAQQQEKLLAWINEAKEELKAKGASEADLSEEAGEGLVFQKVTEKHGAELHADKSLVAAIIRTDIRNSSPEQLREWAQIVRQRDADLAYKLEVLADDRERGIYQD